MNNSPINNVIAGTPGPRFGNGAPVNGVDAVQTLTGAATGGTFKLIFGGQSTAALPFSATAAAIQAALRALPAIGAGNVTCTGGPLGTGAVVATFVAEQSGRAVGAITVDNTLATGGTVTVAQTTAGVAGSARGCATGAQYTDLVSGKVYVNTGTGAKPAWTVLGAQS